MIVDLIKKVVRQGARNLTIEERKYIVSQCAPINDEELEMIRVDNIISAIKSYQKRNSSSLLRAKMIVDVSRENIKY